MKMGPGDYQIYGVGSGHLWVVAGILTMGWDCPLQIIHRGKTYKFSNNEPMEDWMIGDWGGHAKYVEVPNNGNSSNPVL